MKPLKIALIGCGRRGSRIYFPILRALRQDIELVAVVDRVPDLAHAASDQLGVPAYTSLRKLVEDRPMEAAVVVTPTASHHAISCFLSMNGVHNLIETPVADTLVQARAMVSTAQKHGVIFRIGEQFFRDPLDVLSRKIIASGAIGKVGRITHYHSHLGYHNNSRHQVMAGNTAPMAVNAVHHEMSMAPYVHTNRHHTTEVFRNISYHFADGLLITDVAGNVKGAMGRYYRPGYMEIDGSHGTIVAQAPQPWSGVAEVRLIPQERLLDNSGAFSENYPILYRWRAGDGAITETRHCGKWEWNAPRSLIGARVALPQGEFTAENPFTDVGLGTAYHAEVASHVRDFANLVRTGAPDPFTPEMAVASLQMAHASILSDRRDGARVLLNDAGVELIDQERLATLRDSMGIDPRDVEAMVEHSFPQK